MKRVDRMIICVTGMPGSGKSYVAECLKADGFEMVEIGDICRAMMREEGVEINPISLREYAVRQRTLHGKEFFAMKAAEVVAKSKKNVVISGVRGTYEVDLFRRNLKGLTVIALTLPKEMRLERLRKRGRPDDPKTMEELDYIDQKEISWGTPKAMESADFVIANTGTAEELRKTVNELLQLVESATK